MAAIPGNFVFSFLLTIPTNLFALDLFQVSGLFYGIIYNLIDQE